MSEPDIITAQYSLREHGRAMLDRMLSYGWHHADDIGRPYWLADVAADILRLIEYEDRRRHGHIT
jgi:hypothetical protein